MHRQVMARQLFSQYMHRQFLRYDDGVRVAGVLLQTLHTRFDQHVQTRPEREPCRFRPLHDSIVFTLDRVQGLSSTPNIGLSHGRGMVLPRAWLQAQQRGTRSPM